MSSNWLGVVGVSAVLVAAPLAVANAADMGMPLKGPAPPPAVSWTGCYVGAGYGYGVSNLDQSDTVITAPGFVPASATFTDGGRGWLGRVSAGCDYQIPSSKFVVGVLGDFDFMNVHGNFDPGDFASAGNYRESGAWSVGGRLGYLVTPWLLTYWDGGYTRTHYDQGFFGPLVPAGSSVTIPGHTYEGWFLGGGAEYALDFDWLPIHGLFWRNEYRLSEYDSATLPVSFSTGAATGNGETIRPYVQTITSSLIWRFNWGGPVAPRY
jgi:outer membrane immunogenic protein